MNPFKKELFKELVSAISNDNFENKVNEIISRNNIEKETLANLISTICGVEVPLSENFSVDLKNAINDYKNNTTSDIIVKKISHCTMSCADENGVSSCQKSCPFDAILIDTETKTTYIDEKLCTGCGLCVDACKNEKLVDKVQFIPLFDLLNSDAQVVAAVAPAIAGQFGDDVSLDMLRTAFKKVGFSDMVEVAFFADMLTLKEAVEFDHLVHSKDDLMITSCCCPMWVGMLKQVYKDLVKHVSPSISPMIAAGRIMKKLNPNIKVVFIGPCIAKKAEAKQPDLSNDIDFVLTFHEVKDIFDTLGIIPNDLPPTLTTEYASREGRLYARTGGVSISVFEAIQRLFPEKAELFTSVQANGVAECKNILSKAQSGEVNANFIEGMGCNGGCVGGPKSLISKDHGKIKVDQFAENSEIKISADNSSMKNILSKIGINSIEDFKIHDKIEIFQRKF